MGVFITTTDSLVPHVSSKADQVPEKELSRYINDIMKAQRKLNEDNDMSMVDDRNVSKNFQATIIKLLKRALKAAKDYNPTAQYTILQMVTSVISNEEQQTQDLCMFHISKYPSFFKEAGWDLLEWVEPFMYTATGDEPMNGEVRRYATKLFRQVAQQVSYNEVLMLGAEQMSLMDWDDVLSDEEKSVRATIKMVEYFGIFGEAIERITVPQMILDRIVYPTQYISKTVHFLERIIRERSSWGDRERSTSRWDQVVFVMTNSLLDFVEYGKNTTMVNNKHPLFNSKKQQQPESKDIGQDNDNVKRWYLAVYVLMLIFDKIVLNLDMDLTTIYTHQYRWKYNVKRPFENKTKTIKMYTPGGKSEMLDLVFRCGRIAKSLGVTFDNMLRLRRLLGEPIANDSEEEMGKNENEKVNSNIFTISYYGITSLLAISIYDAYIFGPAFNVPNLGLLPMVINPQWIGRECLGLILRLIQDPQRPARVDKGMFLLIFLAKHVNVTVDCKTLTNPRLPGPLVTLQKFDLVQGLEMISSTAAMCPNADLRYVAYQLIKCFIDMCDPEAQLFVFLELLETCPLQAMRAATVNLLKDRIAAAFDNDNETSFFKSHVITDKLFPLIFKKPSSSTLWETYGVEMQVLNCYLYLLIRDKALDQTGVWGDKIIDVVKYTYLEPLEKTIKTLEKEVSGAPNIDSEMKQSQTMQLSLLRNLLDQVNEQLVRKKDRCR